MTLIKQTVYLENNSKKATHFLSAINEEAYFRVEEQEGYFFTPEQLNEYTSNVIKQALETAAEKADWDCDKHHQNITVDKQSITNTFEETFKNFKI